MVRKKKTKILTLSIALAIVLFSIFGIGNSPEYGIYSDCPVGNRMLFSFFHANIFHAAVNAWALISIVFNYNISIGKLTAAYTIAVLFPTSLFPAYSFIPTLGLSAVCFALMGISFYQVYRKVYYLLWCFFFIGFGFVLPNINAAIHLYSYVAGLIVGAVMVKNRWK